MGVPTGPTPSATAALPASPTVVDGSITVDDNGIGRAFDFGTSGTENYVEKFSCDPAAGPQTMVEDNTATIVSTGQSASAQATIHCGAPTTVSTTLSKGTIGQGTSAGDQAAIAGAAATAGGTIKYYAYSDATCTTQIADATPTDNTVVNGVAPASKPITFDNTGTYWWVAVYSGDPSSNTLGSSSDCAAEPLTVQPNDFSISASPSTLSVAQGDSGTSTISTTVVSGSPGTIDLSVSGMPSGATASFDPTSVTDRGSSTLTVDTGTAAPGTYTLTVTGTAGSVTHSTQLALTVKVPDDFSISASPSTVNVAQGTPGSSTISTAVTSGSIQTVVLTVSGVPAGASASFSPASVSAGQSSTLTINTGSAAPGTYTLTVTGTAASGTHSASIALTVNSATSCTTSNQLLGNPGFESGNTSWTATAGVIDGSTNGSAPRTGNFKAWLDGYGTTHTDTLFQTVTIPANACSAVLSFWLKITTAETSTTTAFDKLSVTVRNSSGTVLETLATYSNLNKGTSYVQKSFDISAFKGQTIRVEFLGTEDSSLQTSFFIDDTALNVLS